MKRFASMGLLLISLSSFVGCGAQRSAPLPTVPSTPSVDKPLPSTMPSDQPPTQVSATDDGGRTWQQYSPVMLALTDYRGDSRDLVAKPDSAVAAGVRSLGDRVDYASPPIRPTPGYELTLKGPNGEEAVLTYVGNGNWLGPSGFVEGKALSDAVQAALAVPARQQGELEYLFGATELKVSGGINYNGQDRMGFTNPEWNRRRQVVVRILRNLGIPQNGSPVPHEEPLRLMFTVHGQTETVEVWADTFRYGGRMYQARQILQNLSGNMAAG